MKPTIKRVEALREKTPLCCLVNPEYLCTSCGSKLCGQCNGDYEVASDDEIGLHFTGHLKEKCLEIAEDKIFKAWTNCGQSTDN